MPDFIKALWSLLKRDYGTAAVLASMGMVAAIMGVVLALLHEMAP